MASCASRIRRLLGVGPVECRWPVAKCGVALQRCLAASFYSVVTLRLPGLFLELVLPPRGVAGSGQTSRRMGAKRTRKGPIARVV